MIEKLDNRIAERFCQRQTGKKYDAHLILNRSKTEIKNKSDMIEVRFNIDSISQPVGW